MKRLARSALLVSALAAAVPWLSGCVTAAAVGVGAGALMLTDRRLSETYLADEAVEIRALKAINEKFGDRVHVNTTSYNLKVLLTGEAPDANLREQVERTVAALPNVKGVLNEIQVAPVSSFGARSNDTYITSKVKARFIEANKFSPNHVKVVTEAATVYLLGLVTQREGEDATELARTTSGVRKVVRAFEYITEEQARQLDLRPSNAKPSGSS